MAGPDRTRAETTDEIDCPDCGREIPLRARICPQCERALH